MSAVPKPTVVKNPAYLAWIRTQPCWAAGKLGHICSDTIGKGLSEASHLDGKSRDDRVLPMCGSLHRTGHWAWHAGQKTFCREWNTTKELLIQEATALYLAYKEGR